MNKILTHGAETAFQAAIDMHAEMAITFRWQNRWTVLRAYASKAEDAYILESPVDPAQTEQCMPRTGQQIGVSFELRGRRCSFCADVARTEFREAHWGQRILAVVIPAPTEIEVQSRRSESRSEVPGNWVVRGHVWPGDAENEPEAEEPDCPVWLGTVLDLSKSGTRLRVHESAAQLLNIGDRAGFRLESYQPHEATFLLDAQVRRLSKAGSGMAEVGLQFLTPTDENASAMQKLRTLVALLADERAGKK